MKNLALQVIKTLKDNNYEASLIGGSIRNELHNKFHNDNLPVKDYDIVTNASYSKVDQLFENVSARGEQFKVAVVNIDKVEFEVAQYRGESYPEEGSLRPSEVYEVETLQEDVLRRDFTMNGIAQDIDGNVIDYVNGVEDIKNKIIRAIGNPNERFAEDPLRMLRAIRFVSQLGYSIEEKTKEGIKANLYRLKKIPHERVKEEINKTLKGKYVLIAFQLMKEFEIYKYPFYNSILKKDVEMFKLVFEKTDFDILTTYMELKRASENNLPLIDIYFALYKFSDYEESINELNNVMFLNSDEIFKISILLKHRFIVHTQHPNNLLDLVKDIGEQRGMKYLEDILKSWKLNSGFDFDKLEKFLERPLFKYQLPFGGEEVMEEASKMGMTQKGKWIGEVLNLAQEMSVKGKEFTLTSLIENVLGGIQIERT